MDDKSESLDPRVQQLLGLSDLKLIEYTLQNSLVIDPQAGPAILNLRLKDKIAGLTTVVDESNKKTGRYNKILSGLAAAQIILAGAQVYYAYIQTRPVLAEQARADVRWHSICESNPNDNVTLDNGQTELCKKYFPDIK